MSQSKQHRRVSIRNVVPLLSVFVLAPLAMAPRGCSYGMVGGDCALGDCGNNGSTGSAGSTSTGGGTAAAPTCGGLLGRECEGANEYCDFPSATMCGSGDQTGTCQTKPQACTDLFAPVCGCDGNTYSNSCFAAAAGVSVEHTGACTTSGGSGSGGDSGAAKSCGGLTGAGCDKGQFCDFSPEAMCGAADQTGVCAAVPQLCPALVDPVCGCDGKTYNNSCEASRASVSVASKGACAPTGGGGEGDGDVCGGLLGKTCTKGNYCNFPIDTMCGSGDQTGKCDAIPQFCSALFAPVCGCDGKTYSNACNAAQAGVSVSAQGRCK